MAILLTGGAGRTTTAIAHNLSREQVPFLILSRSGVASEPFKACKFDWDDRKTWDDPFKMATETYGTPATGLYVIAGGIAFPEVAQGIIQFIDFARARGLRRFVLLSQSDIQAGGHNMGVVHEHVRSLEAEIEYVVLRPTWFMDNFSRIHVPSIKNEDKIYSGAGDGKIPWISCEDVGAVGFRALVDKGPIVNSDPILLGPELLTYDEVAEVLSEVVGRRITHVKLSADEYKARLTAAGLPPLWVKILADLDADAAKGVEDRLNDNVKQITGSVPIKFREWAQQNKALWS